MRSTTSYPFSTYIFGGTVALFMGWAMSGCRFGNKTEEPAPPPENPDKVTGYYNLSVRSMNLCVTTATTQCKSVSTSLVPVSIAATLSNPIALIMQDLDTGEAALVDSRGSGNYLPTYVKSDNSLALTGYYPETVLFVDNACTSTLYLVESGDIQKVEPKSTDSSGRPISGNMNLRIQLVTSFEGNCDPTLTLMKACYLNEADCGGATPSANTQLHETVQSVFGSYLDNSVMTVDDIPTATALSRDIQYRQ